MTRMRADQMLVARGLAESRAKAQAAIESGGVTADGVLVRKASELIAEGAALTVTPPHPWVSRAGMKLAHALDVFGVDPGGRMCLDVGSSTGGFTQVLLSRGAARVFAVDVGNGQLHARLRDDTRVVSLESTDARTLRADQLGAAPSLIVCDVSFIGARKALEKPLSLAAPSSDLITLIKPQFEAGPGKGGVLAEPIARAVAADAIAALDGLADFKIVGATDSPIRGGDGNLEILVHATRA